MRMPYLVPLLLLMSLLHAADEDLAAPPVVTAKAWIITDGKTGEPLWQHNATERRKTASTTKMMCACTVLLIAEQQPAVLDERVTFSELAGTTGGSTAAVKPGESVTVKDCLYGLLLPSGNDAGNALAEHFNARLAPPDEAMLKLGLADPKLATRVNFIAEMNRHARAFGLSDTVYRSSFGDGGTEQDRTSTARDLARLAWTAMQKPLFREVVGTRHWSAVVTKKDGSTREASWDNSNGLLALDLGYDGVKTGLTNQAGHCLVASARRGDDHLIVVVLGADSEAARDADVRNLCRWAWTQRQATTKP